MSKLINTLAGVAYPADSLFGKAAYAADALQAISAGHPGRFLVHRRAILLDSIGYSEVPDEDEIPVGGAPWRWPIRQGMALVPDGGGIRFITWSSCSAEEAKRFGARRTSEFMLRRDDVFFPAHGSKYAFEGKSYHALLGGHWRPVARAIDDFTAGVVFGLALWDRYRWRADLAFRGDLSVRLLTDAAGAREMFKMRDVPAGKTRRSALLHWVAEHWRRRDASSDPHLVRQHLRGTRVFQQDGMECSIYPPPFEVEQLACR